MPAALSRLVLLLALCLIGVPADARTGGIEQLRPGEFVWMEGARLTRASNAPGAITITISIADQRAYVFRDGALIGVSTVSTGKPGKETPTGEFTILQKKAFHRSNLYSNAPMPFMQRLTWTGIAIHAGDLPGYPASHGCIRLPRAFAERLFALTALGGSVSVIADPFDAAGIAPAPPSPMLAIETADLGGEAFNVVTLSADGSALPQIERASWVMGPSREVVQPVGAKR